MTPVRLEPVAPWSRAKHSTSEPLRSFIQIQDSIIHHRFLDEDNFIQDSIHKRFPDGDNYIYTGQYSLSFPGEDSFIQDSIHHSNYNWDSLHHNRDSLHHCSGETEISLCRTECTPIPHMKI